MNIPVIDIFAGSGGLSEGLIQAGFDLKLSIEMDKKACETLRIRKFYHILNNSNSSEKYFNFIRGQIDIESLKREFPDSWLKADKSILCAELGNPEDENKIIKSIDDVLLGSKDFILVGGPPCQAYSLAGRSRMLGVGSKYNDKIRLNQIKEFYEDKRHSLYKEYLKILARFKPKMFIIENVKGMLTSKNITGQKVFDDICDGLTSPQSIIGGSGKSSKNTYSLHSLSSQHGKDLYSNTVNNPQDFIVKCEEYAVPQKRHRVIIVGTRNDKEYNFPNLKKSSVSFDIKSVLYDLPKLRSGVSRSIKNDNYKNWSSAIKKQYDLLLSKNVDQDLEIREIVDTIYNSKNLLTRGNKFLHASMNSKNILQEWLFDNRINGVLHHETRTHMESDLARYLFCTCFAKKYKKSPTLDDWQGILNKLKPNHSNIKISEDKLVTKAHKDRFKVQIWENPSSTIVSHIAKDGHYFIHPDPLQCRSLTVREVARLQTFPDNYYFSGGRGDQYRQIGNAVPPFIAYQIGIIIKKYF